MVTARRAKLLTLAAFFVAGLLSYSNILNAYFLSDDFTQIGRVLAGDFSVTWGESHGGFFRPLFILSYVLDVFLWERNQFGFHLTNLVLHVLNSFLVYLIADELTKSQQRNFSLAAGFIFLLHPSHTEAVSWISGRADLLATFFCLLALLPYLSHLRTKRVLPLALSLLSFWFALLSKESAVCLPLLILVLTFALNKTSDFRATLARSLKYTLVFVGVFAVYLSVRTFMIGALVGGYGAGQHLTFTHSVIVSQLLRFSLRIFFPGFALRSMPFLEARWLSPALIVIGSALALLTTIVLMRRSIRRRAFELSRHNAFLLLMWLLFLCSLLPAINLRINVYDTQGERFLYLSSIFFALALGYLIEKLFANKKLRLAFLSCLLLFYFVALRKTNGEWNETAQLSRNIINEIVNQSNRETILLLNAPDNLRGAHLFRNGLDDALRLFQNSKPIKEARVIAFHDLQTTHDEVEVSIEANVLSIRLKNEKTAFGKINEPPRCVTLVHRSPNLLRFRIEDCPENLQVFYFSNGRVYETSLQRPALITLTDEH